MIKNVYIDWHNEDILTAHERNKWVEDRMRNYLDEDDYFDDWLSDRYGSAELFRMTDTEREEAWHEFTDYCHNSAQEDFEVEYDEIELYFGE